MSASVEMWSKQTKAIFNGVLLIVICGALYPIFKLLSFGGGMLSVIKYLLLAGIVVGYVLYLLGLGGFGKILQPADSAAIGKIRIAVILVLVGALVGLIPIAGGFIDGILGLVAYILMLGGFSKLKSSSTFPQLACKGASLLFISTIILLVASVLGIIPLAGGIIKAIFNPVGYILMVMGWAKIKSAQ